ncbi:MAG: Co2+/Mg2+ efflux protein ApaG [Phycisphaera sp.]|nr:Co2+/Mg2+ efflux protein ApaG [Phycisphaera sp.]
MSDVTTHGIRVGASAFFLTDESSPEENRYVFGYQIVIHNTGDRKVQLLSRKWRIIDGDGIERHVEGDGVVGQQPVLEPGKAFKYASFCPLDTPWGTMEGTYTFQAEDWEQLDVAIGRFLLTMEHEVRSAKQT